MFHGTLGKTGGNIKGTRMVRARTTNRREFLQLAHVFNEDKHHIPGWYASEKCDGMRAFWDGGLTRGMYADEVPFANVSKDGRLVSRPKATGLWSRYGKPIQAPFWFLDELPKFALDGELYMGRGQFQQLVSTVKKLTPLDYEWERVSYLVFDLPNLEVFCQDGTVNVPNFEKEITGSLEWLRRQEQFLAEGCKSRPFESVVYLLEQRFPSGKVGIVQSLKQEQLPFGTVAAFERVDRMLEEVIEYKGEGLILRNHRSIWTPQRTHDLIKVKPQNDCEVEVKGYIWGRQTNRGSKLLGLMGAMIVDFNGKRLELSGFTDAERLLTYTSNGEPANNEGKNNPGYDVPANIHNPKFPRGTKVTIKYRELTDDGLPKEARYFRKFETV
jgi:DNA ligase-1